jgi:hypothetical protein
MMPVLALVADEALVDVIELLNQPIDARLKRIDALEAKIMGVA